MQVINEEKGLIKAWVDGVDLDEFTLKQTKSIAKLPFVYKWMSLMPDCHAGKGSTVGSVIPTKGAVMPAAVGVDIGCGMISRRFDFKVTDEFKSKLPEIRSLIEKAIPTGRTDNGQRNDIGAWGGLGQKIPDIIMDTYKDKLMYDYRDLSLVTPKAIHERVTGHLGTLGTGNHFIELEHDEQGYLWATIHSGSRGPGAKIGNYHMRAAKELAERYYISMYLENTDLSYFVKGTPEFDAYWAGLQWAQKYAWYNRELMMYILEGTIDTYIDKAKNLQTVHCNHNYARIENHYSQNVFVTRKGAISARADEWGIIPGSMGAKTFIVQGKGNREAFSSASHGAGRKMSRRRAFDTFTVEDHIKFTEGVECSKDAGLIDETPGAYKDIEAVMNAQKDLVDVRFVLRPLLVVKGIEEKDNRKRKKESHDS